MPIPTEFFLAVAAALAYSNVPEDYPDFPTATQTIGWEKRVEQKNNEESIEDTSVLEDEDTDSTSQLRNIKLLKRSE